MADELTKSPMPRNLWRRAMGLSARTIIALGMVGMMAAGVAYFHARAGDESVADARAPLPVATIRIDLQDHFEVFDRFTGRVAADRETDVAFELGGLVRAVHVDEGDRVEQGDAIAELDIDLLMASQDALEAQLQQAEADRALANRTLDRQRTLANQGHASQQRLDEARFAVDALAGRIASLEAQIREIDIQIEKATLEAPFSGTIAARWRDEGAVVDVGMPIITLLETGRPEAKIGIPPTIADELEIGENYRLSTSEGEVSAELVSLRPDLAMTTRTVEARFLMAGPSPVPFGDLIRLEWQRRIDEPGAWLPLSALREGQSGLWTILTVVERDDGEFVSSETVEIIHVADGEAFVRGTFADGKNVIIDGVNRVSPGQRVAASLGS